MSFDAPPSGRQKIAVIGGGISGLASAYLLSPQHDVVVFEAEPRLGGHARTVVAGLSGTQPVDTGFIVFNYVNYPHLTAMFRDLDVPIVKSDMSFGASIDEGRVEYALDSLQAITGQRSNLVRPGYWRMVRDILRFNARAEDVAKTDDITIGDLVRELGLGPWFEQYYLMPICGAIWSTPMAGIRDFPARTLVGFFRNHALLGLQQHQWYTVKGGSIEYVRRLSARLQSNGCDLRVGCPVQEITRDGFGATVHTAQAGPERFDQVIMACHPDQSRRLLSMLTPQEEVALGNIRYQDNHVILHRDTAQMPKRRACWASWVYKSTGGAAPSIGVTYWMNRLQGIPRQDPLFVSLNPVNPVRDEMIYDETVFRHPVFDRDALRAQHQIGAIQGQNATWFAGAWLRHGFHEDGFASAVRVARALDRVLV